MRKTFVGGLWQKTMPLLALRRLAPVVDLSSSFLLVCYYSPLKRTSVNLPDIVKCKYILVASMKYSHSYEISVL